MPVKSAKVQCDASHHPKEELIGLENARVQKINFVEVFTVAANQH